MSISIHVIGIYKNNKENMIGCYCPVNDRDFNNNEITHIHEMYDKYFIPNMQKFKEIRITGYIDGRCKLSSVFDCITIDTIDMVIDEMNHIRRTTNQ